MSASTRPPLVERLSRLQHDPTFVRNICVMAHVDHGKTTISDSLIASNGIISQRMSGKLRYMDSRKDEQERGITMKSSAISLAYSEGHSDGDHYLINLIDSPGHVDFTGEVSSAIQLCDGALIVVDVVEGVCAQTKVSIRQAWSNGIKMALILNKMDRLITEMKLSPLDAYYRLQQILERVNAVVAELFTSDVLVKSDQVDKTSDNSNVILNSNDEQVYDWNSGLDETDDSSLYFSPDQGNVVFASGVDCWGFRILHFAKMYATKLNIKESVLLRTLWGDFYLNSKLKRIMKGAQVKSKKPLFVQFILDNIWAIYDVIMDKRDNETMEKIIKSLDVKIHARDMRSTDPRIQLHAIFSQWLPLSSTILEMVCEKLPSPACISGDRAEKLMCTKVNRFDMLPEETQALKTAFCECSSSLDAPVIVFISKMFAVDKSSLPQRRPRVLTAEEMSERRNIAKRRLFERTFKSDMIPEERLDNRSPLTSVEMTSDIGKDSEKRINLDEAETKVKEEEDQIFVAFARIFSGTIRKGQQVYVLGPKHDPAVAIEKMNRGYTIDDRLKLEDLKFDEHITVTRIGELYLMMGRELEVLEEVPAGCIFGIGQLENHVVKSATVSSTLACPPFTDLTVHSMPIMRVAVESSHPGDMPRLVRGLKLLNQADASVKVLIQETGEHVIITAGEVHLQRCLDDLRERFAKVEINSSTPIVPFRETIVLPPKTDMVNEVIEEKAAGQMLVKDSDDSGSSQLGIVEVKTLNKLSTVKLRVAPLPDEVVKLLDEYMDLIKTYDKYARSVRKSNVGERILTDHAVKAMENLRNKLDVAFQGAGQEWDENTVNQIWAFGPRHCGPNILLWKALQCKPPSYWSWTTTTISGSSEFDSSFVTGFQLATNSGPLCEEPLRGVCYIVEEWTMHESLLGDQSELKINLQQQMSVIGMQGGPFSGQLISAVREACRQAFQAQPQRLMAAMYSCVILVTAEVLGKMYAVIGKRNGRVLHADLHESSAMFNVVALLPVIESFDFTSEIRRQTSGFAMPQLTFSHWETIETDPFWVPTTKEEYLLFGEKADSENRARKYMNLVRKRKGLAVNEKIVEHAEKQRTLAKKK